MPTDQGASLSRCANTPDADRMVVSASTETQSSPARPPPLTSPGQACSSTFSEAEVVVEEESTRATSLIKGLLSCSRCGVRLEHGKHTPLMLPGCLHTICQTCAEHYSTASEIQCKLCLSPSSGTVEHSLVQALLKRQHVQQQQSRFCGQCVERGARVQTCGVCVECDIDLCADCVQAHQRTKATWSHKIDFCDSPSDEARCTEHRKVFDNYCDTCRTIGCGDCILSAHRSHESSTLEVKAQQIKVAIQAKAQELSELRQYATDMKTTMQQKLIEATEEKAKGVSNVTKHYERYQEVVRSFFQSQRETAEHSYDSHFQSLFNCLNAAGFMDSRLCHASNFISNLLDVDQPLLLVKNAKHVYSCTSRLKGVKLEVPPSNLPSIDMRRVLGIDRIEDMMSLLLYDKDACMQPELKTRLARSFMSLSQQIMSHLLLSNSDYSAVFLRSLFETMLEMPTMSKQMFDMISLFHTEMRKRFHVGELQPPVSDGSGSVSQQLPYVNSLPALSAVSPPAAFLDSVSITAGELIGTENAQMAACSAAVQQPPLVADQQTHVQHKQQQQQQQQHQQQQQLLQQQQQRGSFSQQYQQQQQQHPINLQQRQQHPIKTQQQQHPINTQQQQQQQHHINLQQRQQHPINTQQQQQHPINTQQQQQHPINTQQQQHLHVQQQQQPQYPINPQQLRVQQQQQHHVASQQQPRSHIQQQQRLQQHQQQTVLTALLTGNNPPMTSHMQQDSPILNDVLQTLPARQNSGTQVMSPELIQRQQWAQHMQRTGSACNVAQQSVVTPPAAVPVPTPVSTFPYTPQPHTVHYVPQPQVSQYRPQLQPPPPLQYQQHQRQQERYRQPPAGMTAFPQPGRSTNDEKIRAIMASEHNRTKKNQKRASGGQHASGDQASCTPLAQQLPSSSAVPSAAPTAPALDPVVAPAPKPSDLEAFAVLGSPMLEEDSGFSFKWHNPLTPSPAQPRREIQVPQQFRIQIGAKRMHVDDDVSDEQSHCVESNEATTHLPTSTAAVSALTERSAPGKKSNAGPLRISECVSLATGDKEPGSPADRPTVGKSPTQLLDDIDKVLAEINSYSGSSTERPSSESSVNRGSGPSMPTALQLDAPAVITGTNTSRTASAGMPNPTRASSSPSCEVVFSVGHSSAVGSTPVVAKIEKTSELPPATPVLNPVPLPSVAQCSSTTASTAVTPTAAVCTPLAALLSITSAPVQRSAVSSGPNVLSVLTSQSVSNLPIAVLPSQLVVSPIAVQPIQLQPVVPAVLSSPVLALQTSVYPTQSTNIPSSQVVQKPATSVYNLSSPPQLLPLNEATMARPHAGPPPSGTSVAPQCSGGSLGGTGSVSRPPPPLKVKPNLVGSAVVSGLAQPAKGSGIACPIVTPHPRLPSLTEDAQTCNQTEKRHSSADEALGISKPNQGESPRKRRRSLGVTGSNRLAATGSFKKSRKRQDLSITSSQSNTTFKFSSKNPTASVGAPSKDAAKTSSKGASETQSKGASETQSKGASETPSKGASETSSKGASETPSKDAKDTTSKGASETPSKGASETTSKGAKDTTYKGATETTSKGASETPSKGASETTSKGAKDITSKGASGAENASTDTAVQRPREAVNKSVVARRPSVEYSRTSFDDCRTTANTARSPVVASRAQSGFTRPPTGTRTTSETGHKQSAPTTTASAESLGTPTITTGALTESVPQTPTRISHVPSGASKTPFGTPRTSDTLRSQHSISAGTKQSTSDNSATMTDSAREPTEAAYVIADTPRAASATKYSSAKRVSDDAVKRAGTLPTHSRHRSSEKSLVSPPRPPGATPPNRFLLNRPRGGQTGARTASLHTQSSVRLDEWGHKISRAGVSIDTPIDSLLHSMVAGTASKEYTTSVAVAHHPPTTDKMILDHCAPKRFLPEGTETSVGVRLLMKEPKEIDAEIEVSGTSPKTIQILGSSAGKDNQTSPKVKKKCWKDETAKKDASSVEVEERSQKGVGSDADKLTEVASKSANVVPLKSGTSSRSIAPSEASKHREKSGSKSPEHGVTALANSTNTALQSQIKSKPHTSQQSGVQQGVRQSLKSKKRQSDHSRSSKGRSSPEGTNSSHSDDSVSKQSSKKVSTSNKNSNLSSHKSKHGVSHKRKNSSDSSEGGKSSKKRHASDSSKSRSRHSTAESTKGKCGSSIAESTEAALLRTSPRPETSGDVSPDVQEPVGIEPSDADAVLPKRTSTGGRWKRLRIDSSSDDGEIGSMSSALTLPRDVQRDDAPTAAVVSAEPPCLAAPQSPLPVHLARLPPGGRADLDWDKQGDPLGIGLHPELLYQPPQRRCESPNISFCALCWDGGDLVLCDHCDKSYHSACYFGPMDEHSDDEDTQWQCLMCLPMTPPRDPDIAAKEDGMNEYEKLLATRLLLELYAAYYPALYFKNLENMSLKRTASQSSFTKAWLRTIVDTAKRNPSGLGRKSAFHFSLYRLCLPFREKKLPEFSAIPNAISLDCVREGLRQDEFHSLMHFLRALKKLMDQANYLEKGNTPHRYLRELDEVFEDFVRNYMNKYWFQLDDNSQ